MEGRIFKRYDSTYCDWYDWLIRSKDLTSALVVAVYETVEEFRRREAIRTSGVRSSSIYSKIQLNLFFRYVSCWLCKYWYPSRCLIRRWAKGLEEDSLYYNILTWSFPASILIFLTILFNKLSWLRNSNRMYLLRLFIKLKSGVKPIYPGWAFSALGSLGRIDLLGWAFRFPLIFRLSRCHQRKFLYVLSWQN